MTSVVELGQRAKAASRLLATASTNAKNAALLTAADLLLERAAEIQAANDADLAAAEAGGMAAGPLDRLRLTDARLQGMANGLRTVAGLADPVGEVLDGWKRPNGLQITRTRVPLGVIAIIYENRPNVTSDAAGLCVKAGNAALLRGSSSALQSNIAVASVLRDALAKHALPEDAVILVEDTAYETATEVMQLTDYVDCLIPRGGPSLIKSILDNAKVPVIIDGDGNCHVYVDESADLNEAVKIVVNAKTQRPSVCNAAESLVVHAAVADAFVPRIANVLNEQGVELVGDTASRRLSHCGARFSLQRRHSCRRLGSRAAARVPLRHAKACATSASEIPASESLVSESLVSESLGSESLVSESLVSETLTNVALIIRLPGYADRRFRRRCSPAPSGFHRCARHTRADAGAFHWECARGSWPGPPAAGWFAPVR